jgi:osmoprotectant transport system permease protein
VWGLFADHVKMTTLVMGIAIAIAVPLAVLLHRVRPLRGPSLAFLGAVYTVPSLALFALLLPVSGLGLRSAVIALVAYCQSALVRNTLVGLDGVDPAVREAAAGMGLTPAQIFWTVDAPLALPVALVGVRVAAVSTIAIGTIAAWINAGGLGVLLFEGLYQDHREKISIGVGLVGALAIGTNGLVRAIERRARDWTG